MIAATPTAGLRFASLVRVSTEQQAAQGESLVTQRSQNERDVLRLGGTIAGWYGGQEHSTPGWEKKEVDRLVADAGKGNFDAVIVANADRWSRDNTKSTAGLDAFRKHGIRFFVGTTEYDLFNPEHRLFLGMSAVIGQFQAHHQSKKSIDNRIERARKGMPAAGKLPFGRTFDPAAGWGIDPEKLAMVRDVARRYLAGESMGKLAEEYGVNHANLHKILTRRCGPEWVQEFHSDALNVHEAVTTVIPALLTPDVIGAVRAKAEGNKTFSHGEVKHQYLLSRMVFCSHCGLALSGQSNPRGRYYRHLHRSPCTRPGTKIWVNADELENAVLRDLFDLFGNPAKVRAAVEAATPNPAKVREARERLVRLDAEVGKVEAARNRVIDAIAEGLLTKAQAQGKLEEVNGREATLKTELEKTKAALANIPTPDEVRDAADRVVTAFGRRRVDYYNLARKNAANSDFDGMTYDEKRALAELVFAGKTPDGMRRGVYVQWIDGQETRKKAWNYRVRGRLIDQFGTSPKPYPPSVEPSVMYDGDRELMYQPDEFQGGPRQGELLNAAAEVTSYASY
jgi:site-specific DNA recombinase